MWVSSNFGVGSEIAALTEGVTDEMLRQVLNPESFEHLAYQALLVYALHLIRFSQHLQIGPPQRSEVLLNKLSTIRSVMTVGEEVFKLNAPDIMLDARFNGGSVLWPQVLEDRFRFVKQHGLLSGRDVTL